MKKTTDKYWLREGLQSKITKEIHDIAAGFSGDDFSKVAQILSWMRQNISYCLDKDKVIKIFATRNIGKIIKDRLSMGCHDSALVLVVLARATAIPARYLVGIDKVDSQNKGHCVAEMYIDGQWVIVDQSNHTFSLWLKRSPFYRENFFIGSGLDSWDVGIRSFKTWQDASRKVTQAIRKATISI